MTYNTTRQRMYIKYTAVLSIVVFSALACIIWTNSLRLNGTNVITALTWITSILFLALSVFIRRQIKSIDNLKVKTKKTLFRNQVILLFTLITVIPSGCVFAFSVIFFSIGIENLFKAPLKSIIIGSNNITEFYIQDVKNSLERLVRGAGVQIKDYINEFVVDYRGLNTMLNDLTDSTKLDASIIQIANDGFAKTIANTQFATALEYEDYIKNANLTEGNTLVWKTSDKMCSLLKVEELLQQVELREELLR